MRQHGAALKHVNGKDGAVFKVVNAVYKDKKDKEGFTEADLKTAVLEDADFAKLKFF